MKWIAPLAIVSIFACLGSAEVLDLGDLEQYNAQLAALPGDINANGVWIGQGDGGFHKALGQDVKAKVQGVLEGCGEVDDHCYQDVNNVFDSANVQIDKQLDRRGFASLLSKTFKSSIGLFLDISAYLVAHWKLRTQEMQEMGMWLPDSKATAAGALASATGITISAGEKAVATITQAPDVTSLRGSATPSVTAVTAPSDGYAPGDLVALLDKNLASRIDEMMHRSLNCKDGQDFDNQNPHKKRAAGSYGQAICAAEAVAVGAVPQGPFNDLLLLNPTQLPFGFADATGAVARAANVFAGFMQAYAPVMTIPPVLADQLSVYIFALAIDTVVQNSPLGEKNRIQSSIVKTSTITTTTTTSACPDPTSLVCGMDGENCPMKMPEMHKTKPTCREGKFKDCTCIAPSIVFINFASPNQQQAMIYMSALLGSISSLPPVENSPTCPIVLTGVPMSVFSSHQNKVYPLFCEGWHSNQASKMTVDSMGKNRKDEVQINRKRTPPSDAATYNNWNFDLSFTPSVGGVKCQTDCNGAYERIASTCATNAGGVYIYETGKFDVGCGTFDFKVYKPTTELKIFEQFCYRDTDFETLSGDGVAEHWLAWLSGFACTGTAREEQKIKNNNKDTFIQYYTMMNDVPYQYNVWWKDGCILDDHGPTEVFAANPLMVPDPNPTACQDTLIVNWRNCNNKGVGGNIQVGCLIYEFKADKNKRVF